MNRIVFLIVTVAALGLNAEAENWPVWRGPRGDGTSVEAGVPTRWSETENIRWRTLLPENGHASPIVWGEQLFVIAADTEAGERQLLCLDAGTGRVRWRRTVLKSPLERKHRLNSWASSTPATDGERVYVAFLDKDEMVVAAYDFAGERLWQVRPGGFASKHGFCSSPILWNDKVIVNGDHDGDSYIVALDRVTGRTRWKTPRPNKTRSYCVPLLRHLDGRNQMVLSGDQSVASYDPDTGEVYWYLNGPTEQFVASLVYDVDAKLLFMTGGFPEHHVMGIRPDGRGTIGEDRIAWHHKRASWTSYVPSPIAANGCFILVSDSGYACCFDAQTGKLHWQEKVGSHHASIVAAGGLVYLLSDRGEARVIRPGREYELVAENKLADKFFASPAISGGRLFLRGEKAVYCIGGPAGR